MNVESLPLGILETNCHIVWNHAKDAYVIDPSGEAEQILDVIKENGLHVKAILLTHAHFDHIGALPEVAAACEVPVYLHEADEELYASPKNCMPPYVGPVQNLPTTTSTLPEDVLDLEFKTLHTPGHTQGGVSFYFAKAAKVFSGDCLFNRSIGRTDLPGGDAKTLAHSIKDVLFALPDETQVLSGHGTHTSIGEEKASNPFVGRNAPKFW